MSSEESKQSSIDRQAAWTKNLESLPEDERKALSKRRYDEFRARANSRSDAEKAAIVAKFGAEFGKGGPIRYIQTQESVVLPQELLEFLADIHRRIQEGDTAELIPSGDLLQSESAYGGLNSTRDRYSFVFFPEAGHSVRWQFTLLPSEIESIAEGGLAKLNVDRFQKQVNVP